MSLEVFLLQLLVPIIIGAASAIITSMLTLAAIRRDLHWLTQAIHEAKQSAARAHERLNTLRMER